MASGMPGIAVGACSKCEAPLVISSKTPVTLPCPHCKKPVEGPAEQVLADQWIEPWCKVEGGNIDLEYRLAWVDDEVGITLGCPGCGSPVHPADPAMRCARCNATTWVQRSGKRMMLAMRVDGTRHARPAKATLSLAQGEAALRSDQMLGASADSGTSLLGVTGIGCAIAFALTVLVIVVIIVVAKR
jgi:Zn finger protein HypA/HybF involved in hydrogenase expression